jgi:hypothetical protein
MAKKHKTMDSTHQVDDSKRNMLSWGIYKTEKYDLSVIVHLSPKTHFHDNIDLSQYFPISFFP